MIDVANDPYAAGENGTWNVRSSSYLDATSKRNNLSEETVVVPTSCVDSSVQNNAIDPNQYGILGRLTLWWNLRLVRLGWSSALRPDQAPELRARLRARSNGERLEQAWNAQLASGKRPSLFNAILFLLRNEVLKVLVPVYFPHRCLCYGFRNSNACSCDVSLSKCIVTVSVIADYLGMHIWRS